MAFDPLSWAIGFTLQNSMQWLAKKCFSEDLSSRLTEEVTLWAKSLPKEINLAPEALFSNIETMESLSERPALSILCATLKASKIPSAEEWQKALFERCKQVQSSNKPEDTQSFFLQSDLQIWDKLDSLACRLSDVCKKDRELFQSTIYDQLAEKFGAKRFSPAWFELKYHKQMAFIRDKFIPMLHTQTNADEIIHAILCDDIFCDNFLNLMLRFKVQVKEFENSVSELTNFKHIEVEWLIDKTEIISVLQKIYEKLLYALEQCREFYDCTNQKRVNEIKQPCLNCLRDEIFSLYETYENIADPQIDRPRFSYTGSDKEREDRILHEAAGILHKPGISIDYIASSLNELIENVKYVGNTSLTIFGDAGFGKTHIAAHICDERIRKGLPAIFIPGAKFNTEQPLSKQILDNLDIPSTYSWDDFLNVLIAYGEKYNTRIPIIFDGLNEAVVNGKLSEIWNLHLGGLEKEVEVKTRYIVIITTCRTTYRTAIWDKEPLNYLYATGFNSMNVREATRKFFDYYKIRADLTAAPLSQFKHPIYLKIFCEITNPERKTEKYVYIGEQSIYEVFDQYVQQCNKRVCKIFELHPDVRIIDDCLRKMAESLWNRQGRHIPIAELTLLLDDTPLNKINWDKSKSKMLLSEGLLASRDYVGTGEVVFFTYELIGGYLIAKYLLQKNTDNLSSFITSKDIKTLLFSDKKRERHPLWSDIGRSLAALMPMQTGDYLHDLCTDSVSIDLSVRALFEISPSSLNDRAIDFLSNLFSTKENRALLFELAQSTIFSADHPLNMAFWSKLLSSLSIQERDASWTEYLRENVKEIVDTISEFEAISKNNETWSGIVASRMALMAIYTMWALTSTVRPLRDRATRSLYWYGCNKPSHLLALLVQSFGINDPYVSERMLAAIYGVAMAKQFDFNSSDFKGAMLMEYGKIIFDMMFKPDATSSTTHILARDYAVKTIEMALIHHPDLLVGEQLSRVKDPFINSGIRQWGESEDLNKKEYRDGNYPLGTDFENYTLGSLIKNRRNYDFENKEFQQVRANIFWRIYQLGYSLCTFGEIDKEINRFSWRYARSSAPGKTDRYGKKYCWIAFYELVGYRRDQREFSENNSERYYPDIDPSFPNFEIEHNFIQIDYLGDRATSVKDWILNGGVPDFGEYLVIDHVIDQYRQWVLIDGFVQQKDEKYERGRFVFLRAFIIKSNIFNKIVGKLNKQNLGGRWLPEIPEDHYTYAGEIPWCVTYAHNGLDELQFIIDTRIVEEIVEKEILCRDNIALPREEADAFWASLSDKLFRSWTPGGTLMFTLAGTDGKEVLENALRASNLKLMTKKVAMQREEDIYDKYEVLIPVKINCWADSTSTVNHGRAISIPAREITDHLDLCSQPQTFDLFEKNGKRASMTFKYGKVYGDSQNFMYLRKDLLDRYLSDTDSRLVWAIWGEREYWSENTAQISAFSEKHESHCVFQEIKTYD